MEAELIIEKRRLKRFIVNVKILDQETNECIGYSANMHTEGMMVTSPGKIPLNTPLKIKLVHLQLDDEIIEIPLVIEGLWNMPGKNPDFYNTGFRIVNPDAEQVQAISRVIEDLAV